MLAAPGGRIAGGTSQVQRNLIGEWLPGLPGNRQLDRFTHGDLPRLDHSMKHEAVDIEQPAQSGSNGPPLKLIVLLLVVLALAIFFFQNGQDAQVDYLWMNGTWPVWTVIGISVIAGVVLDRLGTWQWRRARKRKQADES
jgi:uncharacterized integral membrane protein